jgi:hypothetical protein
MIDRESFFARVRATRFGNAMHQGQVDGCNALLDAWEARSGFVDPRWLAYMLATAKWETANTMQSVEECGSGAGLPYGVHDLETGEAYYGRGYVQITGRKTMRACRQRPVSTWSAIPSARSSRRSRRPSCSKA